MNTIYVLIRYENGPQGHGDCGYQFPVICGEHFYQTFEEASKDAANYNNAKPFALKKFVDEMKPVHFHKVYA